VRKVYSLKKETSGAKQSNIERAILKSRTEGEKVQKLKTVERGALQVKPGSREKEVFPQFLRKGKNTVTERRRAYEGQLQVGREERAITVTS